MAFCAVVFGFAVGDEFERVVLGEGFADGCECADDSALGVVGDCFGVELADEVGNVLVSSCREGVGPVEVLPGVLESKLVGADDAPGYVADALRVRCFPKATAWP